MCIVITGAGKGIGLATAECLANRGHDAVLVDVDAVALEDAEQMFRAAGQAFRSVVGSVADPAIATRAAEAARELGGASGFVHSAGIQTYGTVKSTTSEGWDKVISVNLTGGYVMAHALIDMLIDNKGACVFIASVQGLATQENVTGYTVSKHGLIGLSHSIAVDFAKAGVRSNAIAPGSVHTPMLEASMNSASDPQAAWKTVHNMHPMGRIAEPGEIATVAAFLLSDDASFITGEVIRVDGGLLTRIAGSPE